MHNNGTHPVANHQYENENRGNKIREEPATRVITMRPTLAGDSNKAQKKYGKYAMISHKVLFNVPITKKTRTR